MNPLLVSDVFPPKTGGSGRWFWEVYRRLPRGSCVVAAGEDPRAAEFDRGHDLRVVRVPLTLTEWGVRSWPGLRGYGRAVRQLLPVARRHRVDRVHAARCLPEGVIAWCLKRWLGLPYLCYVHGEEITCTTASRELRWLARRVVAGAEALVANCRNTAAIARDLWGARPEQVRVLNPGVDTQKFRPAALDAAARARLGWGARPVVLTVGRLQKRKGHDVMIRALDRVRRELPDVLYAVLGAGEEEGPLRELVGGLGLNGHVQFLGECGDDGLVTAYQQCDLFVLPNRQVGRDIEGFGMVLLEAQACGKPVLAGASGGTAETMKIPDTGRVLSCDGPDELAPAVAELLTDPDRRARMGRAARAWAVERFDWSSLARQAAEVFEAAGAGAGVGA